MIAMGLIPGGKLAKHFKKLTGFVSKLASAAWSAAKQYAMKGVKFLWKASGLDLAWKAAKVVLKGCGCFEAGTEVWTQRGPVAIETLQVGDLVFAEDEKTGVLTLREVTKTFVRRLAPIVAVTMLTAGGQAETFPTTEEHPFLVEPEKVGGEPAWRRADHLKPGDVVRTIDGAAARVESITYTSRASTVYNLEVEGLHNYHVGASGVVVHNTRCIKPFTRSNFRNNLGLLIPAPTGYHAHHRIPHEYRHLFPSRNLNDPLENGAWSPGESHISEVTALWNRWGRANPGASAGQVENFAKEIENTYGHMWLIPN